jgi:hypothetical protein
MCTFRKVNFILRLHYNTTFALDQARYKIDTNSQMSPTLQMSTFNYPSSQLPQWAKDAIARHCEESPETAQTYEDSIHKMFIKNIGTPSKPILFQPEFTSLYPGAVNVPQMKPPVETKNLSRAARRAVLNSFYGSGTTLESSNGTKQTPRHPHEEFIECIVQNEGQHSDNSKSIHMTTDHNSVINLLLAQSLGRTKEALPSQPVEDLVLEDVD